MTEAEAYRRPTCRRVTRRLLAHLCMIVFGCLAAVVPAMAGALNGGPVFSDAAGSLVSQRGCVAIESYGGVANGSAFNDAALAAAVAASDSFTPNYPCVRFGVGTYRFQSTFSYTVAYTGSITLVGEASSATKLQWMANQNALLFNQTQRNINTLSTFHLRHLTVATEGTNAGVYGLILSGVGQYGAYPMSDLTDVSFEGADGHGGNDYWGVGIWVNGWSEINIVGGHLLNASSPHAGTIGILLSGSPAKMPSLINIQSALIGFYDIGIQYASYTQGVTVSQTNILGCSYGVYAPANQAGLSQLTYTNNQSNCSKAHIRLDSVVNPVQISNNLFESAGGAGNLGLVFNKSQNTIVTGNVFLGQGGTGIVAAGSVPGAAQILADNIFSGFATATNLTSTATGWTVHDNRVGGGGCIGCVGRGNREHDNR